MKLIVVGNGIDKVSSYIVRDYVQLYAHILGKGMNQSHPVQYMSKYWNKIVQLSVMKKENFELKLTAFRE